MPALGSAPCYIYCPLNFDSGGTNLRVGFIELSGNKLARTKNGVLVTELNVEEVSRAPNCIETKWSIEEQLKLNNAEDLFNWIGKCMADEVEDDYKKWPREIPETIPLGVTFSFPIRIASPAR